MEGMIPMNGQHDNLIDRFDGRALLDFYRDPVNRQVSAKTEDELELEEVNDLEVDSFSMQLGLPTPHKFPVLCSCCSCLPLRITET